MACLILGGTSAKADSVVYLIDNLYTVPGLDVKFNGDLLPLKLKIKQKEKMGISYYNHQITKCIIKNDGRLLIERDYTWFDKPYHDEITLDLNDGDVYYIDLVNGMKSKIKLMSDKDGEKTLKKAASKKDWTIEEEEIVYEN